MEMRVIAYGTGLNLRGAPAATADNVLGKLYFLQKVAVEGPPQNGFLRCTGEVDGKVQSGFASAAHLRPIAASRREDLLDQVSRQYQRFERGLGKEHLEPFSGYVGEMWRALGIDLDGTDRDQPWSAAAISFMVRNSGAAYQPFRFASAHSKFTFAAIQARRKQDRSAPFWGYDLFERPPQAGDIVVRDNPDFAPAVDFGVAGQSDSYRSHSDVIVHVDSARQKAIAIGGNVSDSVSITEYDLAAGDYLAPTKHTFALLANRSDEVA